MTGLTPTQIAEALNCARPDLDIVYGNTGGWVMCITASDPGADPYQHPETAARYVVIGTAGDHLGWSTADGDAGDEWVGLVSTEEEDRAWSGDEPLEDGAIIVAQIAALLQTRIPILERCPGCDEILVDNGRPISNTEHQQATGCTGESPIEAAAAAAYVQVEDLTNPDRIKALELALNAAKWARLVDPEA